MTLFNPRWKHQVASFCFVYLQDQNWLNLNWPFTRLALHRHPMSRLYGLKRLPLDNVVCNWIVVDHTWMDINMPKQWIQMCLQLHKPIWAWWRICHPRRFHPQSRRQEQQVQQVIQALVPLQRKLDPCQNGYKRGYSRNSSGHVYFIFAYYSMTMSLYQNKFKLVVLLDMMDRLSNHIPLGYPMP